MGFLCGRTGEVFQENALASRLVVVRGGGFGGELSILLHFDALKSGCTLSGDEEGCFLLNFPVNRVVPVDVDGVGLDD